MRRSQLPLSQQLRQPRKGDIPAAKRSGQGRGNRDLLASLGAGKAMPDPVQAKMEQTLGADFSGVRLYESPLVAQGGAEAAASGNKVAFAPGKLNLNSPSGLELLGHELSHVASQARGEVSGHGLVQDSALEHKADADGAKAMHAFDPVSGGNLTPMSSGPAPGMTAGPVQAKKSAPTNQEKAEHFRDLVFGQDMAGQVRTMRDMALYQASVDTDLSTEEERMVTGLERGYSQNSDFFDELFNQQLQAARALDTARTGFLTGEGGEMDDARADFLAKYSRAASEFQGYSILTSDIGEKTTTARSLPIEAAKFGTLYLRDKAKQLKEMDPDSAAILERAHNLILHDEKHKNPWAAAADGGQARSPERGMNYASYIREMAKDRDASISQDWYEANTPKKQSLLSRLFHRKKRH